MDNMFRADIDDLYARAERCATLAELMPALYDVLRRNGASLSEVTYAYRLRATDTDYVAGFALDHGRFSELSPTDPVDVTVTGSEANLLRVFQRKLNPAAGLLLGKIKVAGSKAALMKLSAFL